MLLRHTLLYLPAQFVGPLFQLVDGFLQAQKELLQAGLQLRSRQDDVAEAASAMFGLPTRKDFDDVTRQLTELRREVRTLTRQMRDQKVEGAR